MCNNHSEGLLSDYTDGALSPVQAARVRRHLHRCPACARELAALRALTHEARQLYMDAAPVALVVSVRPRRAVWRPLLAVGVIALVAGMCFLPEMPGRPRVAFADVENAMRRVKTVHWTATSLVYDPYGRPHDRDEVETWAQLQPLALATRDRRYPFINGAFTATPATEGGYLDKGTQPMRRNNDGSWMRGRRNPNGPTLRQVVEEAVFSPKRPGGDPSERRVPWQRAVTSDGLMYYKRTVSDPTARERPFTRIVQEVWADSHTYRLTRRVNTYFWMGSEPIPGGRSLVRPKERVAVVRTESNFRYNKPLPKSVFELQPLPGAKVKVNTPRTRH